MEYEDADDFPLKIIQILQELTVGKYTFFNDSDRSQFFNAVLSE